MSYDSRYGDVALLLHGDGTDGSTTFVDSSPAARVITANGNPFVSTTQSKFGGASISVDGAGDYLTAAHADALNLASGDFTIEGWLYCTALTTGNQQVVNKDGTASTYPSYAISLSSTGKINGVVGVSNGTATLQALTGATSVALNAWTHVAFTRQGTALRVFVAGVLDGTLTQTITPLDSGRPVAVAGQSGYVAEDFFRGFLDDVRITKGVARYTATFTPPTAAHPDKAEDASTDSNYASVTLSLHGEGANGGTVFTDSSSAPKTFTPSGNVQTSTAQSKFGGSSLAFDGSGDFLTTTAITDFTFGAGDFTIEGWAYTATTSGVHAILGLANGSSQNSNYAFQLLQNGTQWQFNAFNGTTAYGSAVGTVVANAWTHFALVRSGTSLLTFINGALLQTTAIGTVALNAPSSASLQIGQVQGFYPWSGYLDDLRVTKGLARYTTNFTAPTFQFADTDATAPPTTVTASSLAATTTFGTPVAAQNLVASSLAATTAFGTPTATQNLVASGVDPATTFGTPLAVSNQITTASSLNASTAFGTPLAAPDQIVTASSLNAATSFGTPSSPVPRTESASGTLAGTAFGAPTAVGTKVASPVLSARTFGVPKAQSNICSATSVVADTRVGYPVGSRPAGLRTKRIVRARFVGRRHKFGLPRATKFALTTTALTIGADLIALGTPVAVPDQLALPSSLGAGSAFGTPVAVPDQLGVATGLAATVFGTPTAALDLPWILDQFDGTNGTNLTGRMPDSGGVAWITHGATTSMTLDGAGAAQNVSGNFSTNRLEVFTPGTAGTLGTVTGIDATLNLTALSSGLSSNRVMNFAMYDGATANYGAELAIDFTQPEILPRALFDQYTTSQYADNGSVVTLGGVSFDTPFEVKLEIRRQEMRLYCNGVLQDSFSHVWDFPLSGLCPQIYIDDDGGWKFNELKVEYIE